MKSLLGSINAFGPGGGDAAEDGGLSNLETQSP
jgi:hypothetical protein